ncbi:MAG: hypothetical protein ACI94O_002083 [Octadecabacter sp.]
MLRQALLLSRNCAPSGVYSHGHAFFAEQVFNF